MRTVITSLSAPGRRAGFNTLVRKPLRRFTPLISILALAASACAGPGVLVAGEAAFNPEPGAPVLAISAIAGDDNTVVTDAEITIGRDVHVPEEDGAARIEWRGQPVKLAVSAPGFVAAAATVEAYPEETDGAVAITLEPLVLKGTVVGDDGRPLPATTVALNGRTAHTDESGTFELTRALAGELSAERPAWEPATATWDGAAPTVEIAMQPRDIRALRVSGDKAASESTWNHLLELVEQSSINALVVDTKDESGWVFHESRVPLVEEIGALNEDYLYDAEEILADMDRLGLYKITRITTFQDNFLAQARPDMAITDENTGELWRNDKGIRWLDATDRNSWEYPLALAEEACDLGFDEIQFDYIRFPSDGNIQTVNTDGDYAEENRIATVKAFLEEAYSRLNPMGCAVAADIFAITLTSDWDEGIGQRPEVLSKTVDVLSPMVYTYTYGRGWGGFDNPNEHPVEIVEMALDAGIPKNEGHAIYRPWIQTWQLTAAEINAVQAVVEERDLGWMIWSANTLYDSSFLPPP